MNKAATEQDLYSILPGLTGALPSELLQLTTSLLAQSRSKASGLKPDEEIARSYVCANIACERLKQKLDLPDIKPRPPCPNRTYKKVYQYLTSALTPTAARQSAKHTPTSTPTTPRRPANTTPYHDNPPSRTTPLSKSSSLRNRLADSRTRSPAPSARSIITAATTDDDFPSWLMPAVRALCAALDVPAAASHVFAGVSSVARTLAAAPAAPAAPSSAPSPSRKRARPSRLPLQGLAERLLPPLAFVVASYVAARFGGPLSAAEYRRRRDGGFALLVQHSPFADMDKEEFVATVEQFLREGRENGWFEMQWSENVEDAAGREGDMGADEDEAGEGGDDDEVRTTRKRRATNGLDNEELMVAKRGGGEMRMYAVDWLSEKRSREFKRWEVTIRAELDHRMKS